MEPNRGIGFEYDERSNVPSYDEVASVMKRNSQKTKKQNRPKRSNHKKSTPIEPPKRMHVFAAVMGAILLLAIIAGGGYAGYKYREPIFSNVGKITGNFVVTPEGGAQSPKFPFEIKGEKIDLKEQEDTLVNTLNSNCETEKGKAVAEARIEKDNQCVNKINPIQDALDKAEANYDLYKDKYDECKEDLDTCEEASS
jgi:hypothetical protein